jgi:hypothetical protein
MGDRITFTNVLSGDHHKKIIMKSLIIMQHLHDAYRVQWYACNSLEFLKWNTNYLHHSILQNHLVIHLNITCH